MNWRHTTTNEQREWNRKGTGHQGGGVGIVRSWRFLGGVGVGFLTTLRVWVWVGFFSPTPDVQSDQFLQPTREFLLKCYNFFWNFRWNWCFLLCTTISVVRRKFSWEGFIQWHMLVICIWCALFVTSQFNVIALFPNQRFDQACWHNMHVFLYVHSPYFMCHWTEYKLLELQVRLLEENTPNATKQQFVTAIISCGALKQGSTTHSSIRQSNLQRKNEAALMACRIWAVEHRVSAGGLAGTPPVWKIESC